MVTHELFGTGLNSEILLASVFDSGALISVQDLSGAYILINQAFRTAFHATGTPVLGNADLQSLEPAAITRSTAYETVRRTHGRLLFEEDLHPESPVKVLTLGFPVCNGDSLQAVGSLSLPAPHIQELQRLLHARTAELEEAKSLLSAGIADRRRAEHARRATELLNQAVLSSLRAHIAVLDRTGNIITVNEAWRQFARDNGGSLLAQDAVGMNYLDVCRRAAGELFPYAELALNGLSEILDGSRTDFVLEYPCHAPDRQRWFLLSATPLVRDDGGVVVSHSDITERVLAEQKARQSSERYRALIENALDIVTILEPDGTIRYESPAISRVLGYEQEELIGRNALDFIHPEDRPVIASELERLRHASGSVVAVEFGFLHKDGHWRIIHGMAKSVLDNAAVAGIVVNSRDVTDRRQSEAQIREKEAALRRSHEQLQNLTGQLFQAEERERRRLSRELHDDLNQRLAMLAVDVGSIAKALPDSDASHTSRELRALQSRIAGICEDVRVMAHQLHPSMLDELGLSVALRSWCAEFARRENIHVRFVHRRVPAAMPQELTSTIYRIVQEALRNSAKHSGSKSAIVSLIGRPAEIILTVRDFGAGFAVDAARTKRGLGLTSIEERTRLAGGSLTIVTRPGKGTRLTVRLPWTAIPDR